MYYICSVVESSKYQTLPYKLKVSEHFDTKLLVDPAKNKFVWDFYSDLTVLTIAMESHKLQLLVTVIE